MINQCLEVVCIYLAMVCLKSLRKATLNSISLIHQVDIAKAMMQTQFSHHNDINNAICCLLIVFHLHIALSYLLETAFFATNRCLCPRLIEVTCSAIHRANVGQICIHSDGPGLYRYGQPYT